MEVREKINGGVKIGILDLGSIPNKSNSLTYIQDKMDEGKILDELNYSRFWVAEHHDVGSAWQTPEVVITLLAACTEKIRIGVAGVLMPIHNPLRIAQCYKLLNNLFSNRIDLGIAKSYPRNNYLPYFIENGKVNNLFDNHFKKVHSLLELFMEDSEITIPPYKGTVPEIWILGNSNTGTLFSIAHKLSLCFSFYHVTSKEPTKIDFENYKKDYCEKHKKAPKVTLSLSVLASNNKIKLKKMEEELLNRIGKESPINLKGDYSFIKEKLNEYKEVYNVDEFILVNFIESRKDRYKFYEEIAEIIN